MKTHPAARSGPQFASVAIVVSLLSGACGADTPPRVEATHDASTGRLTRLTGRYSGWPVIVSPLAVAAVSVAATLTGVVAGSYPAWKAASIQPIDALMHD